MKRREFIAGLLVAATLGHARAQRPTTVHRIAFVTAALPIAETTESSRFRYVRAFFHGLRRFGYIEGRNLIVERYPVERPTVELARDVVRSKPDLIFAVTHAWVQLLKPLTATIPIVATMADPVGFGFVASLAHPRRQYNGGRYRCWTRDRDQASGTPKGSLPAGFQGRSPRCPISREESLRGAAARGGSKTGSFAASPPAGRHPTGDRKAPTFFRGDGTGTRRLSLCGWQRGKLGVPPIDRRAGREESTAGYLSVPRLCRSRWSPGLLARRRGAVDPRGGVHCSNP